MKSDCFLNHDNVVARKLVKAEDVRLSKNPACYIIENKETGNIYVGSTKNISARVNKHKYNLEAGIHSNANLQKEYDSCVDKNHFIVHVLPLRTVDEARDREQLVLDEGHGTDTLLNISDNARNPSSGYDRTEVYRKTTEFKRTPEARERQSKQTLERWNDPVKRKELISAMGENIVVDGVKYGSVREAGRETGVSIAAIRNRLVDGSCSLSDINPTTRAVSCEGVVYPTVHAAAVAHGIKDNTMTYRLQSESDTWKAFFYLD